MLAVVQRVQKGGRVSAGKEFCSQPGFANLKGREENWNICCCDLLLQWLKKLMHFSVLTTLVLQVMNYRPFSSYDTLSNCVSSN